MSKTTKCPICGEPLVTYKERETGLCYKDYIDAVNTE